MKRLDAGVLVGACGELSGDAGVMFSAKLEPLAGPGGLVKPAAYEGGRYQLDRRWWGEGVDRRQVDVVSVDNVPSQANRLEAALEGLAGQLGLPQVVLDLGGVGALPPHLPTRLSGFRFPHRQADAYLRDALLNGERFTSTPAGRALIDATGDAAGPILEWFPQALLFGYWQSHLGKKRSQSRLARSWVSEIVGYDPATVETRAMAVKGDPLNLSVTEQAQFDPDDELAGWELVDGSKKAAGKGAKGARLSELGHGQVIATGDAAAPAGVSFAEVVQQATVSFASLRRVRVGEGTPDQDAAARAVLVALGIVAHVGAFGRAFSLRSGCDLRPVSSEWMWLGASGDEPIEPLGLEDAVGLFLSVVDAAEAAGLPVGSRWPEPLVLEPDESLAKAIKATWPLES